MKKPVNKSLQILQAQLGQATAKPRPVNPGEPIPANPVFEERIVAATVEQLPMVSANVVSGRYTDHLGKIVWVATEQLVIADNVRKIVNPDEEKFAELVESIREHGLLQNLVADVRISPEGKEGLLLVSGQRRLLACRVVGISEVPVLLRSYASDHARIADGLVENLCREGLSPADIAEGYARLLQAGWSREQIAARFDRGSKTVSRYLQLSTWPAEALTLIRQCPEVFSTEILFNRMNSAITSDPEVLLVKMRSMVRQTQGQGIVKTDEQAVGKVAPSQPNRQQRPHCDGWAAAMCSNLGIPVKISEKDNAYRMTLRFNSEEDIKQFVTQLGITLT